MKKTLLPLLVLGATLLASCGGNTPKGVQGKSFDNVSCTGEKVNKGTSEEFYNENNPAGSTKEAVVNKIAATLYTHGTADNYTKELFFSTHAGASNILYNDKQVESYDFNYIELSSYSVTSECQYISLNSDFTSVHFIGFKGSDYSKYVDMEFSLGSNFGSQTGIGNYSYKAYFVDNSVTYSATDKKLTVSVTATFESTENETSITSAMDYTLVFNEK